MEFLLSGLIDTLTSVFLTAGFFYAIVLIPLTILNLHIIYDIFLRKRR